MEVGDYDRREDEIWDRIYDGHNRKNQYQALSQSVNHEGLDSWKLLSAATFVFRAMILTAVNGVNVLFGYVSICLHERSNVFTFTT